MHLLKLTPLLALLPLALADLELDQDDVPQVCRSVCAPIVELTRICDVQDDDNMTDREEDLLEQQCICTNDSFDVAGTAARCAACMNDNADRDDREDISSIMGVCGFSTTSFDSSATTSVTPTVAATRPTGTEDLTTTFVPSATGAIASDGDERTMPSGGIPTNASQNQNAGPGLSVSWEVMVVGLGFVGGLMLLH